ncbi:MAG: hypothetical protein L3J53_03625 [Proteobacteria bacterium]|nr:hypothetical protein [Pseudomonadota bacterium]
MKISVLLLTIFSTTIGFSQSANFKNWKIKQVGSTTVYTPSNLESGGIYNITLFKVQKIDTSHQNWLKQFATKDEKNLGKITYRGEVSGKAEMLGLAKKFQYSIGKKFDYISNRHKPVYKDQFALYMSHKIGNSTVGVMRINYDRQATFKKYQYGLREVGKIMRSQGNDSYIEQNLAKYKIEQQRLAEIERKKADERTRKKEPGKRAETEKELKKLAIKKAIRTAPNKGLKPSQVEAVTYHMDYEPSVYGVDVYYENYLLLKDGWAYDSPTIPPSDFNVATSKKLEPQRWSQWKKNGKILEKYSKGSRIKPAIPNQTLDARLSFTRSWALFGSSGGSSTKHLALMKNGRFESSYFSYAGGHDGEGGTVSVYSSQDKKGTTSGSGSTRGSTKTQTKEGVLDKTGTYTLNGYILELHHDSGKISRLLFGFTHGNERWIYIDGTNYKNENYKK